MGESLTEVQATGWIRIDLEITIAGSREQVWTALVDDMGAWWPDDFYATPAPRTLTLEAYLGGRVFEQSAGGAGLVWYQVQSVTPGESLHLVGHLAPPFGGPATTLLHLTLEERNGSTVLHVTDCLYGNVDEKTGADIETGWRTVFVGGLKQHVETS